MISFFPFPNSLYTPSILYNTPSILYNTPSILYNTPSILYTPQYIIPLWTRPGFCDFFPPGFTFCRDFYRDLNLK